MALLTFGHRQDYFTVSAFQQLIIIIISYMVHVPFKIYKEHSLYYCYYCHYHCRTGLHLMRKVSCPASKLGLIISSILEWWLLNSAFDYWTMKTGCVLRRIPCSKITLTDLQSRSFCLKCVVFPRPCRVTVCIDVFVVNVHGYKGSV